MSERYGYGKYVTDESREQRLKRGKKKAVRRKLVVIDDTCCG